MYSDVTSSVYLTMPKHMFPVKAWTVWVQAPLTRVWNDGWVREVVGTLQARFATDMGNEYVVRCNKFREAFQMGKPKVKAEWDMTWMHVDLTPEQKGQYRAWDLEDTDVLGLWAGFLSAGYKVNTAYNAVNGQFSTSLICRVEGSANEGLGLTGYANDLINSMRVVFFKATVVLPDRWQDYQPPGGTDIG